jgi:hypothetical protein
VGRRHRQLRPVRPGIVVRPSDAPGLELGVHGPFDDDQAAIVEDVARRFLKVQPDLVGLRLDLRGARVCSPRSLDLLATLLELGASLDGERLELDGRGAVRPGRTTTWMDVPAVRAARAIG